MTIAGNISANSQTITPTQIGYLSSITSDVQTQINNKQNTLTSSSNISANNITASGLITANNGLTVTGTITLPSASIATSAIASGSLTVGTLVCSSENDTGLGLFDAISEKFQSITSGTNAFTLNYGSGTVFYLGTGTTLNSNFSIQLNNCSSTTTQSQVFTLIYNTSGKYYCNSITAYTDAGTTQITLSSSVPLYANGTPSTITTSTIIVATFSLLRMFGSNYVLCSTTSFY